MDTTLSGSCATPSFGTAVGSASDSDPSPTAEPSLIGPTDFTSPTSKLVVAMDRDDPHELPPLPLHPKKKNSKESPMWEYFTRIPLAPESNIPLTAHTKCNYCGKLCPCHHKKMKLRDYGNIIMHACIIRG